MLVIVYSVLSTTSVFLNVVGEVGEVSIIRIKTALTFFAGLTDIFITCMIWFVLDEKKWFVLDEKKEETDIEEISLVV